MRRRAEGLCGRRGLHRCRYRSVGRYGFKPRCRYERGCVRGRPCARRDAARTVFNRALARRCTAVGRCPRHRRMRRFDLRAVRGLRAGACACMRRRTGGIGRGEHAGSLSHGVPHGVVEPLRLDAREHGQQKRIHDGLLDALRRYRRCVRPSWRLIQDRCVRSRALAQRGGGG